MPPRIVFFDCAETLVSVRWQPGAFAIDCAGDVGIELDAGPAREIYERLLEGRWRDYELVNRTKDHEACRRFWRVLTADWLAQIGAPETSLDRVMAAADRLLYGPESPYFSLFPDVLPALTSLERLGIALGVISNWDYSLHRVLGSLGLYSRFATVIASLEEGVEKPDRRLFELALARAGVEPHEAVHVGDNPIDDFQGAKACGLRAILLDRTLEAPGPDQIPSLSHLPEAMGWKS